MYYLTIILAILLTSLINVIFIKYGGNDIKSITTIALYVLPLTFIQSSLFAYYYSVGSLTSKFGLLVLIAMSLTIVINFLIHFFYFKESVDKLDLLSISFITIGIIIYIYKKF